MIQRMAKPDINRLIAFHDLLISLQQVERHTLNPRDTSKHENDVEHSYYLAMAAWMLAPHFKLDKDTCIRIALAHDLIEVYAGDTFIWDDQSKLDSKAKREADAFERLQSEWPDFDDMLHAISAYEHKQSPEAEFIYALDKLMPIIVNVLGEGHAWQKNMITFEKLKATKDPKFPEGTPAHEYYQQLLEMLQKTPHYFYQEKK